MKEVAEKNFWSFIDAKIENQRGDKMKIQFTGLVVLILALSLFACAAPNTGPSEMKGPATGPGAAVIASANAFNAGDLEKSLGYYADDAAIKLNGVPPGEPDSFKGKDALRAWFKGLTQVHFQIQVEVLKVEGDTVTTKTQSWMDPTRALGVAPIVATEVYVVKDGKITSETWTISPESAAKLQAATTSPIPSPPAFFLRDHGSWKLNLTALCPSTWRERRWLAANTRRLGSFIRARAPAILVAARMRRASTVGLTKATR